MAKVKKPTVVLGGGATGLAAAYRLCQKGKKVILIEKEKYLGGLAATLKTKALPGGEANFLYEFGPHAFHLKDPQITSWLKKLLAKDFRIIPTNTHILIDGQILSYPLKASELLKKIPLSLGVRIISEYVWTYFKNTVFDQKRPDSFQSWGLKNFGPTLYKMSFGDYTSKVWGVDPAKLSEKLASQKLSRLNLGDIILKLLGFKGQEQPTYFRKYLYPKKGIEVIFEKMAQEIRRNGQILLGSEVKKLKNVNGRIKSLEYQNSSGKTNKINVDWVISTVTLDNLAAMINHPVGKNVREASRQLRYRDLIIVYLVTEEQNQLFSSQWIYLVENKFHFNRVTVAKNLSPLFAPPGQIVLAFEICCQKGDELWQKQDQELLIMVKEEMRKLNLDRAKVSHFFVKKIENAYPIYLKNFEKKTKNVFDALDKIDNLISTGRNGLYLNSDMHDCFQMGFAAARRVARGLNSQIGVKKKDQNG